MREGEATAAPVHIRFTGAARAQLLDEVAAMARDDREGAAGLVRGIESVLLDIAGGDEPGRELALAEAVAADASVGSEHRLYYRVHRGTVWVLALWSPRSALGGDVP